MANGGARAGAGRPAGKHGTKVTRSVRLSQDVSDYLDAQQAGQIGDFLDSKVRATKGFRDWTAKKSGENSE